MLSHRILTIQDISCVGQCSLTVALPILSACGLETAVLPSAVLSTHTAGFKGFTCRDLTDDMPLIRDHWIKENLTFDAIYTGYLGSETQIGIVESIADSLLTRGGKLLVDPAMADGGRLYPAFDEAFVNRMKALAFRSDILLPNLTEACFLTGLPYKETSERAYLDSVLDALHQNGAKTVVLTGVSDDPETTGVFVSTPDERKCYHHRRIPGGCHGTGDIYASAFTGAYLRGHSVYDAAVIAADYTVACIEDTIGDKSHWYGARFEPSLPLLIRRVSREG